MVVSAWAHCTESFYPYTDRVAGRCGHTGNFTADAIKNGGELNPDLHRHFTRNSREPTDASAGFWFSCHQGLYHSSRFETPRKTDTRFWSAGVRVRKAQENRIR